MKRIIIVVVIVIIAVAYFFLKNSNSSNPLQTVKENLQPISTKQSGSFGADLPFPLRVNGDYSIKLFSNLDGAPRALALDPNGNLMASIPASGRIVALPDTNSDGIGDRKKDVVTGLTRPHGFDFSGGFIYIGEEDKVTRYKYDPNNMTASERKVLFNVPAGGRHTTRSIKVSGEKLYVSVGSSCDVCVEEPNRADILVSDLDGSNLREFAKGLRNTVFFTLDGQGRIWGADMGRDFLGDSLPPEEVNLIEDGEDYGWPYCYGNKIRDSKFPGDKPENYCEGTQAPKFEMPAHIAPLGITFDPDRNILVAQHGSWNSSVPVGYKVVKINKSGDTLSNMQDFITGFISGEEVLGRPVDLVYDSKGNLFVSDDKADNIYIVFPNN